MKTGYLVRDAMTARPITIRSDATLQEAALLMRESDVGSLVVGCDGELLGIVTEYDLVHKAVAAGIDPRGVLVAQVMTRDLVTVAPGTDVTGAIKLMRDADIRHLPVMELGKLVGFITLKDILRIQPQLTDLIANRYELERAGRRVMNERPYGEEEEF